MGLKTIVLCLIGFGIGFAFGFLLFEKLFDNEAFRSISTLESNASTEQDASTRMSIEEVKKIRILCFLNTRPKSHGSRAVHIMKTWGKHCDKILFASTMTDVNLGAIGFNLDDNHASMWGKVKLMLKHIHENYIDDYDWFLKGDDDMFLMPENMRFLLSAYSQEDPIYFGHKFKTKDHKWGYFSGGSGYVMSRKTVRVFVEIFLTNQDFYREFRSNGKICHIESDFKIEDWHISTCLDYYNVYAGDSRDLLKRDHFFPFWPQLHLLGSPSNSSWYWNRKYYFNDEGLDGCSNYSIAYHYISANYQYTLYYLPPRKKIFSEVARILNEERVNKTLRGY